MDKAELGKVLKKLYTRTIFQTDKIGEKQYYMDSDRTGNLTLTEYTRTSKDSFSSELIVNEPYTIARYKELSEKYDPQFRTVSISDRIDPKIVGSYDG